ncbi:hypothetical protein NIES2119_30450 [[Phormidium ambiguum] IAM M-71]|uniref:Aromatic-ring-hydroxylating dioxygenase alpha subunit C-terminal domain-containing protein n=1 Tax=[Phormidium ambiguum] IAM M-71 TaxID=454136 RepID=A0A1U7I3L8_9CYAN|nr:hypothetical protein NIES2119_30450 [Phormidium ambiguum IAM M-71]
MSNFHKTASSFIQGSQTILGNIRKFLPGNAIAFSPIASYVHLVNVITWEGFIFLNLSQSPEPFTSVLPSLIGKFRQWYLPQLRVTHRIEYNVKANWKLIFLNYCECYHCPVIHPNLAKLFF